MLEQHNDYELGVCNGDTGTIVGIDSEREVLRVRGQDFEIDYPFAKIGGLTLAYAMTVHKAQGSEYPYVVIPVSAEHERMLTREVLYTAITRARHHVIVLASRAVLQRALSTQRNPLRVTGLQARLQAA